MRRFIAIFTAAVVLQFGVGCKHVGGKCDCGPTPGEAHTYAPTATYNTPILSGSPTPGATGGYEGMAAPKVMPK